MIAIGICDLLPMISLHQKPMQRCWEGWLAFPIRSRSAHWRLTALSTEVEEGTFTISDEFEDVHSKIEYELTKTYGDVGKKSHCTFEKRSGVGAMQLYLKDEIQEIKQLVKALFEQYMTLADRYKDQLLPGYTICKSPCRLPLGCGFLPMRKFLPMRCFAQYRSHPLWPKSTRECCWLRQFLPDWPTGYHSNARVWHLKYNVVAAQMSRGKLEKNLAQAIGSLAGTLSRFSMDVCLYMSQNFDFISFPDDITTGSSIMPHKKPMCLNSSVEMQQLQALPNDWRDEYQFAQWLPQRNAIV